MITAIIPAHDEEPGVGHTVACLHRQTRPPERVVVVADGSTDDTVDAALLAGAEVLLTVDNVHRTAGALNQALATVPLGPHDLVLVLDAATELPPAFLEAAVTALADRNVGAVAAAPTPARCVPALVRWCALEEVHEAFGRYYDEGPVTGQGRLALDLETIGWRLAVAAPAAGAPGAAEATQAEPARVGSPVPDRSPAPVGAAA